MEYPYSDQQKAKTEIGENDFIMFADGGSNSVNSGTVIARKGERITVLFENDDRADDTIELDLNQITIYRDKEWPDNAPEIKQTNQHVRLTIEFDIDGEALHERGITVADVFRNISFGDDDVIDGFVITTDVPGFDRTSDFFLTDGKLVAKELIPQRSRGDGLDKWRQMIRDEIDLNYDVYIDGLTAAGKERLLDNTGLIDKLAERMQDCMSGGKYNEYQALERVFNHDFSGLVENMWKTTCELGDDRPEEEEEVLLAGFKAGLSDDQMKFITANAYDWMEMDAICSGFKLGISLNQMAEVFAGDEPFKKLDGLTEKLLAKFREDNMDLAITIAQSFRPSANVIFSPDTMTLLINFRDNYSGTSGWKYSGCLKLSDIAAAGFSNDSINELLRYGIISRRNTSAESYELSIFERMALISGWNLAKTWEEKDGNSFRLNNGYNGEIHRVMRAVLKEGKERGFTPNTRDRIDPKPDIRPVKFSSLIPGVMGRELDNRFEQNNWELQLWSSENGTGYQIFFGKGVQVDNNYEYGFPHLMEEEDLIGFAKDFYDRNIANEKLSLSDQIDSAVSRAGAAPSGFRDRNEIDHGI